MSTLSAPKASIPTTTTTSMIAVFDLCLALEALPDQQQPQSPAGHREVTTLEVEDTVRLAAVARVFVGEEATCPFCMEGFGDEVVKQGRCGHVFHDVCVSTWVSDCYGNDSCPLCRCKIV